MLQIDKWSCVVLRAFRTINFNYSTAGSAPAIPKKRLNKLERSNFKLDDTLKQVLIGNILGDVYLRRFSVNANTRIVFRQGSVNTDYLLHLYDLFKKYSLKSPSITTIIDKDTKKSRYNLSFATMALPCFNEFYNLFYLEGNKRVPINISKYLTRISLAYWIMDDGGFTGTGLKLYTNAYKFEDLNLLIEALDKNLGLKATIHKTSIDKQHTLYISKSQLPLVIELVEKYMHPTMLYKLNIKSK